jgi:hypothetical protein
VVNSVTAQPHTFAQGSALHYQGKSLEHSSQDWRRRSLEGDDSASVGTPSIARPVAFFRFPHRAAAALLAISFRCVGDRFAARALPPALPSATTSILTSFRFAAIAFNSLAR